MAKKATSRKTPDVPPAEKKADDVELARREYSDSVNEAGRQAQQRFQKAYSDYSRAAYALGLTGAHGEALERVHQAYRGYCAALQAAGSAGWTAETRQKAEDEHKHYLDAHNEASTASDAVNKEHQQIYGRFVEELKTVYAETQVSCASAYRSFLDSQQRTWSGIDVNTLHPRELFAMARGLTSVAAHAGCTPSARCPPAEKSDART